MAHLQQMEFIKIPYFSWTDAVRHPSTNNDINISSVYVDIESDCNANRHAEIVDLNNM